MHRRNVVAAALAAPLLIALSAAGQAAGHRISGPVVHENLAIYFVHGPSVAGRVPLTLGEALAEGAVKVHETGNVNELTIENLGSLEVFVHSGDIVKGGQQDRVLTISMLLPPNSGRVPIAAFCVEQGRWSPRGREDVRTFSSASAMLPSRDAKIAMNAPPTASPTGSMLNYTASAQANVPPGGARELAAAQADTMGSRQQQMWRAVQATQSKVGDRLGASVAAPQSATSLQLSLEHEKLKAAQVAYLKALQAAGEKDDDIVGYVFAINGKINSAEIYPSNGLFRKLWMKLLSANATEAIGERKAAADAAPGVEAVRAFLDGAERGKTSERPLPMKAKMELRDAEKSLYVESRRADGGWLHRSYLAKQ